MNDDVPFVHWLEFLQMFKWRQGEHLTLVGPTGGGKTTLALKFLPRRNHTIVFATKKRDPLITALKGEGFETVKTADSIHPKVAQKFILAPPLSRGTKSVASQAREFSDALQMAFRQGGWTIYLDEARYICDFLKLAPECELLLQQGRSLGVTMVAGTQRPVKIPLTFYDQATHLFFWRENDETNLKRLGGLSGVDSKLVRDSIATLPLHEVLYLNTRRGDIVRTKALLK